MNKFLSLILSSLLLVCCSDLSTVEFTSENDQAIWVYGITGYNTQARVGILSKGKIASTVTNQKSKLSSEGRVMWTEYKGAETSFFYEADNPKHRASYVALPNKYKKYSSDVTFVFEANGTWRVEDNDK